MWIHLRRTVLLTRQEYMEVRRDQYSKKHLGDIIIAADGHNITTSDDLVNYIGQHKSVGDNVTLTVYRNGHIIDLKTTLAA